MLTKPISMIDYFFAENMTCFLKVAIYFVFGILIGLFWAGPIAMSGIQIIIFLISLVVAILAQILLELLVGVFAFFTEENKAFHMIFQKISFLLVFTPLEFYPEVFQKILLCLPTTYIYYVPAKIFSNHPETMVMLQLLGMEILIMIILWTLVHVLYQKGVEKINVNGG